MGVGAVAMLYPHWKRTGASQSAGLIRRLVLALTPVATLMFRYNNPDALLVLLLIVAGYCTVRAVEADTVRRMTMWMAWTGCAIGFASWTKMLQASSCRASRWPCWSRRRSGGSAWARCSSAVRRRIVSAARLVHRACQR